MSKHKCTGSCERNGSGGHRGEVRHVSVRGLFTWHDGIYYCEAAVERDQKNGFRVETWYPREDLSHRGTM